MIRSAIIVFTIAFLAAGTCLAADDEGFVAMFNGKDLSGWEGMPGAWWVEDGAITGQSTQEKPSDKTHYLYWKGGEPSDFILRFQIKLLGGNSGVQFRSETRPDFDAFGYQADFDAANSYTGCLYHNVRNLIAKRGMRVVISPDGTREEKSFTSMDALAKKVKLNDWNDYKIVAEGSRIALLINGQLMCEVDDRNATQASHKGIIALQMHKGPPMKVQFKDLRIKVL